MPSDPAQLEDVLGFGLDLNSHALYNIAEHPTLFKLNEAKWVVSSSTPGMLIFAQTSRFKIMRQILGCLD